MKAWNKDVVFKTSSARIASNIREIEYNKILQNPDMDYVTMRDTLLRIDNLTKLINKRVLTRGDIDTIKSRHKTESRILKSDYISESLCKKYKISKRLLTKIINE